MEWPQSVDDLVRAQQALASERPPSWRPPAEGRISIGGCFLCFPRGMPPPRPEGEPYRAAAAVVTAGGRVLTACVGGFTVAPYRAGLLALREGEALERAVRRLSRPADVLLVNATGRDHPRRAGLALHLGAALGLPTVGVTHRALLAEGAWPPLERGRWTPLRLEGEVVGSWLCTRTGARPLAVHAAWRTDPATARTVVLAATRGRARTPNPLRHARRTARRARTAAERRGATADPGSRS